MRVPILPRGGGTSQCGQTVGTALVIDNSKHLNKVLDVRPRAATVEVQPGMVLDHLNAFLKPHGLWYPVDVSTSAQATLGGMAGNNSCGSRSIAYGNMVHNVLGIDAILLADGSQEYFGPVRGSATAAERRASPTRVALRTGRPRADEIERCLAAGAAAGGRLQPRCVPSAFSERPYTTDGQVNLAHLLVGSEGTLACTSGGCTLKLSRPARAKVLGVVNFPSFYAGDGQRPAHRHPGPSAVELVDRTMIELARQNPAFRPVIETALIGQPAAILLVEFAATTARALLAAAATAWSS
jgi:FAD/FMN-containing dehydrogenase